MFTTRQQRLDQLTAISQGNSEVYEAWYALMFEWGDEEAIAHAKQALANSLQHAGVGRHEAHSYVHAAWADIVTKRSAQRG